MVVTNPFLQIYFQLKLVLSDVFVNSQQLQIPLWFRDFSPDDGVFSKLDGYLLGCSVLTARTGPRIPLPPGRTVRRRCHCREWVGPAGVGTCCRGVVREWRIWNCCEWVLGWGGRWGWNKWNLHNPKVSWLGWLKKGYKIRLTCLRCTHVIWSGSLMPHCLMSWMIFLAVSSTLL